MDTSTIYQPSNLDRDIGRNLIKHGSSVCHVRHGVNSFFGSTLADLLVNCQLCKGPLVCWCCSSSEGGSAHTIRYLEPHTWRP